MRSYWDLTIEERAKAIKQARMILVAQVVEGVIELEVSNKKTQAMLNRVLGESRRNETPDEAKTFLLVNRVMRTEVDRVAVAAAEGSRYSNEGNLLKEAM